MALNNVGLGLIISAQDFASGSIRRIGFALRRTEAGVLGFSGSMVSSFQASGLSVQDLRTTVSNLGRVHIAALGKRFKALRLDTDAARLAFAKKTLRALALTNILKIMIPAILAAAVAFGAFKIISATIQRFAELDLAIRETVALMGQTREETRNLTKEVLDLSEQFGTDKATQAKAFYQTVSAGFVDTAESAKIMATANKLAIGGVTDVRKAVDVLVPTLRAFNLGAKDVTRVSDQLFTTVRLGRTTINELTSALGTVTPTASAAGIKMEEMLGALVGLTRAGLSTSKATTALNAVLSAVIKPTTKAQAAAKRLGVDFSLTALRSKGLVGFLKSIKDATGGSVEEFSSLFGRIRALRGALPLLTSQFDDLGGFIGQVKNSTGATDKAFKFVAGSTAFLARKFTSLKESVIVLLGGAFEPLGRVILESGIDFLKFAKEIIPGVAFAVKATIPLFAGLARTIAFLGKVAIAVFTAIADIISVVSLVIGIPLDLLGALLGFTAPTTLALAGIPAATLPSPSPPGVTATTGAIGNLFAERARAGQRDITINLRPELDGEVLFESQIRIDNDQRLRSGMERR